MTAQTCESDIDMESAERDDSHPEETETPEDKTSQSETPESRTPESKTPESETPESKVGESKAAVAEKAIGKGAKKARSFQIGAVPLALGVLALALAIAVGVLGYVVTDRGNTIDTMKSQAADTVHAEKVALDYATGAAQMDYNDLAAWNKRLTSGTSKELSAKLTDAATAMEQVIVPLQWKSTSSPVASTVKSHDGDVFVVAAFVSVNTKNAQAPDGVQSTASYTVTVDRSRDWLITDVGGVDAAVGQK